jgi:hypothetical protein
MVLINLRVCFKKLQPYTLTRFDLATLKRQSPRWQAVTMPPVQNLPLPIFAYGYFSVL